MSFDTVKSQTMTKANRTDFVELLETGAANSPFSRLRYHSYWGQRLFCCGVFREPHWAKEHFRELCSKQVYRVPNRTHPNLHLSWESQKGGYLEKKKIQNDFSNWILYQPYEGLCFPQPELLIHPNIHRNNKSITLTREGGFSAEACPPCFSK